MRKFVKCIVPLALFPALALAGPTAYAPNGLFTTNQGMDDLVMFDVDDPAGYTVIGPMGVPNVGFGGMDFDAEGNLYAYASFFHNTGGAASGLYSVNMQTGQATPIGNSIQSLDDIGFNPADGEMYGVRSQNQVTRLYRINLTTGQTSLVGVLSADPPINTAIGLAFDSEGNIFIHNTSNDTIYSGFGLSLTPLYEIPQDTNFSQGMTIDWSRDDTGYHAAVGRGVFPNYFSQLNTFAMDGSGYFLGDSFGPLIPGGDGFNYPPVQLGDVAIVPASGPEPCSSADLAEPFGELNFFDLAAYLALFNAQDPAADLNQDGQFNFFDIGIYLDLFNAGCP
ncbi:MAG: DUF4394 domain-containing protein [Phycisphaerales bacterium]|nr:hypothetical protein [Planctomycetota bacterium]MCH8508255.1 DUF4394 domain-containing protein [Phycisphaerales bacterium]